MSARSVEITLDVCGLRESARRPQEIVDVWDETVVQMYGRTLRVGDSVRLLSQIHGAISFVVIGASEPVIVTAETSFSIHSLIEAAPAEPPCVKGKREDLR